MISSPSPAVRSNRSAQLTRLVLQCCFGLIPFLIVPGLETPDLPPRLLLLQMVTLAMVIGWFWSQTSPFPSPFYLPLAIFAFAMVTSSFWAITPFFSVHLLAKYATLFCFFLVVVNTFDKRHLPAILRMAALAGAGVSLLGMLEYHGLIPLWIPSTGRPSSTFMFRNLAAHYLITNLPLTGLLFLMARSNADRWISSVSAVLMFVFLLYTRTRGAWLGLFVSTMLNLSVWIIADRHTFVRAIRPLFNRRALQFAVGALIFVAILGPLKAGFSEQHTQRFDEKKADISSAVTSIFKKGGDRGRMKMWQLTLNMIADHPAGVGLGNWEIIYPLYDRGNQLSPGAAPKRPHNDLLWIWSETGFVGIVAFLSILAIFLIQAIRLWRNDSASDRHLIILMCGIAIFAMIGDGFFNFPWERIPPTMNFWFALAIAAICFRVPNLKPVRSHTSRWAIGLLIPLLICAIWMTGKHIAFDYYFIKAFKAHLQDDHARAVAAAEKAIDIGPFNHQIFILNAQHLKLQKRFVEAEHSLQRCATYHPFFPNTFNNWGNLYDEWGQYQKANAYYRKTLELMPNHHRAYYNMGIVYEKMGYPDSAMVAYRKAILRGSSKAYHNLAGLFKLQGQIDSAQAYYLRALSAPTPVVESLFNLGNLFVEQKDFGNAIRAYEKFAEKWQGDPQWMTELHKAMSEAHSGQGVQFETQGNLDEAVQQYQTAIEYWPENAMGWYNLANAYRQQNKIDQSISSYLKAIERDSTFTNAYNNLGLIYTDQKRYTQAIETFQKAVQIHPKHAVIYLNLGNAYLGKGDIFRAVEAYEQCLKFWDGAPETVDGVRRILKELKTEMAP